MTGLQQHVVVTGGAGFIGSHVVDRFVANGARVTVVDDLSVGDPENIRGALERGAQLEVLDVLDEDMVSKVFQGADAVVHMACSNLRESLGQPLRSHQVNATGALVTALAARDGGVRRYVYVSSSEACGSAVRRPMDEDHPLEPVTVYGAAKAAGELYARSVMRTYGLPVVVARAFNAYGPREHATGTSGEVIPRFVQRILTGRPPVVFGDGSQTRDFTWVEDTAEGITRATTTPGVDGQTLNIASGREVSVLEIARTLLRLLDAEALGVEHRDPRPGDVAHHHADVRAAGRALRFRAGVALEDGLRRYVSWVRGSTPASTDVVDRNW